MINLIKLDSDSSSQSSESSDNQFLLLEDSSSSDSNSSSSQSSCDCVGNCLCQIHQVNMISGENNFLIEIIESILDPNLQKEYFKKFLEIQKQSNQKSLENNNNYNLKTVLDKFSSKLKSVGIQDLQHEISEIKLQINIMLVQNEDLDLRLKVLEKGKIQIEETKEEEQLEGESSQLFVNAITKMIRQKWHIKIRIFIKPDFSKNIIALVDSGADINCIQEGLIPSEYFEKTIQRIVGANKQALGVEYKVSNVHVCNKNVCYKISLLLVKDMNKEMILGTPFLSLLYPLTVDKEGIKTIYENQEICFYFLNALEIKELNFVDNQINLIQNKKQQIKFLGKEIHHKIIEENLLNKDIQTKVEKIKKTN